MTYQVGQIFQGTYPPDVAVFCNASNSLFIQEIAPTTEGVRQFRIEEAPAVTEKDVADTVRSMRDEKLDECQWYVNRHVEQMEIGTTTLTQEQYKELLAYRQALRDVPQQESFPNEVDWPVRP